MLCETGRIIFDLRVLRPKNIGSCTNVCLTHPTVMILQPRTKSTYEIFQLIKQDLAELQTPGPPQDLRNVLKMEYLL